MGEQSQTCSGQGRCRRDDLKWSLGCKIVEMRGMRLRESFLRQKQLYFGAAGKESERGRTGVSTRRLSQNSKVTECPRWPRTAPSLCLPFVVQRPGSLGVGLSRVPALRGHVQTRQDPVASGETILFSDPSQQNPLPPIPPPKFLSLLIWPHSGRTPLARSPTSRTVLSPWLDLG